MGDNIHKWGWYSELQAKGNSGYYVYEDINGNKVNVTEVTSNPNFISHFMDAECMGQVNKFLEAVKNGTNIE